MLRGRSSGREECAEVRQRTRTATKQRDTIQRHSFARIERCNVEQEQVGGRAKEGASHHREVVQRRAAAAASEQPTHFLG